MEFDRLVQLFRTLHDHQVEYVLVRGVVIDLHGLVRKTEHLVLCVRPTAENLERLRHAFRVLWDDPAIEGIRFEDPAGDVPTTRYRPPVDEVDIDLIARIDKVWRFEDLVWPVHVFQGVPVRVLKPSMLYGKKESSTRTGAMPRDFASGSTWRE